LRPGCCAAFYWLCWRLAAFLWFGGPAPLRAAPFPALASWTSGSECSRSCDACGNELAGPQCAGAERRRRRSVAGTSVAGDRWSRDLDRRDPRRGAGATEADREPAPCDARGADAADGSDRAGRVLGTSGASPGIVLQAERDGGLDGGNSRDDRSRGTVGDQPRKVPRRTAGAGRRRGRTRRSSRSWTAGGRRRAPAPPEETSGDASG